MVQIFRDRELRIIRALFTRGGVGQGLAQEIGCKAGEEGSGGANAASANVGGKQFTRQSAH